MYQCIYHQSISHDYTLTDHVTVLFLKPAQLQLRLVGGSKATEGRVEVLHDGEYGTICSEQFGDKDARVICKMLGFP